VDANFVQTKLSAIGTAGAKKAIKIERPHLSVVGTSQSFERLGLHKTRQLQRIGMGL